MHNKCQMPYTVVSHDAAALVTNLDLFRDICYIIILLPWIVIPKWKRHTASGIRVRRVTITSPWQRDASISHWSAIKNRNRNKQLDVCVVQAMFWRDAKYGTYWYCWPEDSYTHTHTHRQADTRKCVQIWLFVELHKLYSMYTIYTMYYSTRSSRQTHK